MVDWVLLAPFKWRPSVFQKDVLNKNQSTTTEILWIPLTSTEQARRIDIHVVLFGL